MTEKNEDFKTHDGYTFSKELEDGEVRNFFGGRIIGQRKRESGRDDKGNDSPKNDNGVRSSNEQDKHASRSTE